MKKKFSISSSLGVRVFLLVFALSAAAFAGLFFINSRWQEEASLELIASGSEEVADVLMNAVAEPMAVGDNEGTWTQFRKIAEHYDNIQVFLTNWQGNVTYATDEAAVRQDLSAIRRNARLDSMVRSSLQDTGGGTDGGMIRLDGRDYFVQTASVPNAPACHHCHGASKPVLGSMVMFHDVSPAMAHLRTNQLYGGFLSAGALLLLVGSLSWFMRRSVVRRVQRIADVSRRISSGDYDVTFDEAGRDEIASLSESLGEMVTTIRDQMEYSSGLLKGIGVPMFVTDNVQVVEFVNEPMLRILGRRESEALGRRAAELFSTNGHRTLMDRVLESGRPGEDSLRFERTDGRVVPLRAEVSPLRDAEGRIIGAVGLMMDLTREEADKARIRADQEKLRAAAGDITEVAGRLSASAEALRARMEDVDGSMNKTVGQTHQLATAISQMDAAVQEVSRNAVEASGIAGDASSVAGEGGKEVEGTVKDIHGMADRMESLASSLADLSRQADGIGQVMGVIHDIADQTNLLALNAAIEAARAGDAGRGFAVVADEVRKLASKTQDATGEVERAVSRIQQGTQTVVSTMADTSDYLETTSTKAAGAGEVLSRIVDRSATLSSMVQSIASAAVEQEATSGEISGSVKQISSLSEDVTAKIHEADEAIREVAELSQVLNRLVGRFEEPADQN